MGDRRRCGSTRVVRGGLALFSILALGLVGCDSPQAPTTQASHFAGNYADGLLEFQLDGSDGETTALTLVATALEFDATTEVLRAQVAVRNDGSHPVLAPTSIVVNGFVPVEVAPLNATCSDSGATTDGCAFDYHGTGGADGLLTPGEVSTPVEWQLHVPGGQSFAFHASLGATLAAPGNISGHVFADADRDGFRDSSEVGVARVRVLLHGPEGERTTRTDAQGHYAFQVETAGIYGLEIEPGDHGIVTTPQPLQVTILRHADGSLSNFDLGNFGIGTVPVGPAISIEGFAFVDIDRNGVLSAGDATLANVKMRGRACPHDDLADDDDNTDIEVRTDASGHYALALPDCGGPWEVRGGSVEDYERTSPRSVLFLSRPDAGTSLHADFGYTPEASPARLQVGGVQVAPRTLSGEPALRAPGSPRR